MLPLPRRRLDPDVVRERLRALASGGSPSAGLEGLGLWSDEAAATVGHEERPAPSDPASPPARTSVRPVLVAVVATALAAWVVVRLTGGAAAPTVQVVPGTPVPSVSGVLAGGPSTQPASSPSPSATGPALVVQVLGQVRRPGLVSLPSGSRVADAVLAAGGLVRGGSSGGLNLARLVVDGEQIVVSQSAVAVPAAGPSGAAAAGGLVDLNAATVSDLDSLPGVGPVMASRILDWRTAHGRFASVDQLREVSGIGARIFERLKPRVRV